MFLLRKSPSSSLGLTARLSFNPARTLSAQSEPRSNEQDEGMLKFVGYCFEFGLKFRIFTEFRVLNLRQVRNQRQLRKRFVRPELPPPR